MATNRAPNQAGNFWVDSAVFALLQAISAGVTQIATNVTAWIAAAGTVVLATITDLVGIGIAAPTSTLHLGGSFATPVRYTAITPDVAGVADNTIVCTAGALPFAENLPATITCQGREYTVKKGDAGVGTVTCVGAGPENLEGGAFPALTTNGDYIHIKAGLGTWLRLDSKIGGVPA